MRHDNFHWAGSIAVEGRSPGVKVSGIQSRSASPVSVRVPPPVIVITRGTIFVSGVPGRVITPLVKVHVGLSVTGNISSTGLVPCVDEYAAVAIVIAKAALVKILSILFSFGIYLI